jgi:hypothetical protein
VERIIAEHRRLWRARNREGGLEDSVARLEPLLAEYEPGRDVSAKVAGGF